MNIVRGLKSYGVGSIVLFLCGCSSFARVHGYQPATSALNTPTVGFSAIGAAPIGVVIEGLDPATGASATIKVTRAYDSAAGHACREYVVLGGAAAGRSGLVCLSDGAWQEVVPLVSSQGYTAIAGPTR